ncbi:MAG: hypothetical protein WC812_02270 [Candidatus Pacearchaeota archaeon]|jgi:hypothetical protein
MSETKCILYDICNYAIPFEKGLETPDKEKQSFYLTRCLKNKWEKGGCPQMSISGERTHLTQLKNEIIRE